MHVSDVGPGIDRVQPSEGSLGLADVIEIAARRAHVLPVVAVPLAALLLAQTVHDLVGAGGDGLDTFFDHVVHNFLLGASAAACLVRAWTAERGRLAWTMIGLSLAAFTIGDVVAAILDPGVPNSSSATVVDVFWLAYYPLVIAGLAFMIRDRIEGFDLHRWIDGIAAGLIIVTLGVSLFVHPVFEKLDESSIVGGAIQFAYPILDVMILGAAIGIFALTAWRPGKMWLLLSLGLCLFAGADSVSAVQIVEGTYEVGKYDFACTARRVVDRLGGLAAVSAAPAPCTALRMEGRRASDPLPGARRGGPDHRHLPPCPEERAAAHGRGAGPRRGAALDESAAEAKAWLSYLLSSRFSNPSMSFRKSFVSCCFSRSFRVEATHRLLLRLRARPRPPMSCRPLSVSTTWTRAAVVRIRFAADELASSSPSRRFVIAPVESLLELGQRLPGESRCGSPPRQSARRTFHSPWLSPRSSSVSSISRCRRLFSPPIRSTIPSTTRSIAGRGGNRSARGTGRCGPARPCSRIILT